MGYNKFRLDMNTSPSEHIRIAGDIIFKHYNGQTTFNFMDFMDKQYYPVITQGTMTDTVNYYAYRFADTLFFDNIFLEFHHAQFDLIIGRQQIPSGVGYAWNPTDIFNEKDIFDPTYENPGVDALQLRIPLGSKLYFTAILQPDQDWRSTTQYFEIKTWLSRFDISLLYGKQADIQSVSHPRYLIQKQSLPRDLYGLTLEGQLFGLGVRTEIAVNRLNYANDDLQYEYILGGDYTFKNSLYLLGEYYHNDFGVAPENTKFIDFVKYYNWERKSLHQNYFFGLARYPLTDLTEAAFFSIINLDDHSLVLNPQIVYRIYQDVEITLMGNLFLGAEKEEFGYQDYGGRIRLRAYF